MRTSTLGLLAGLLAAPPVLAADSAAYTYDAHGRLVAATHTSATGTATVIGYDPADNRSSYVVSSMGLSIADASVNEGGSLVFTVTRSGSTAGAASVSWATSNGTAVAGTNYTASSGTASFAAGATSATVTVPTTDDNIATANLSMQVTLSSPSAGAVLLDASATGTVKNTDAAASMSIGNAGATEGAALVFTVTRSGNTGPAVTVNYATANGTALAGSDYMAASGVISYAAGETAKTVSVSTIDNTTREQGESMTITLSGASVGATIASAVGTGTITDNDATLYSSDNTSITSGQYYFSPDGRFKLIMQADGNLVLYMGSSALWSSGTAGNTGAYATFQNDGNLVVYRSTGTLAWSSNTAGNPGSFLVVQTDGNMVIYRSDATVAWATHTCCH